MALNIEGEGLLDIIYYYIWLSRNKSVDSEWIAIPDTIVYKYQQPRSWYFTSVSRKIKKKSKEKLKAHYIEEAFLKNCSESGIVAWYIYIEANVRTVEFLNVEDFKHLLHYRKKAQEGILQKFIDPKGERNTLIQMVWSPSVSLFELRENIKDLYDTRYDVYERAVTFEGEDFHSTSRPICSKVLKDTMQTTVNKLARYILEASGGKVQITRMVLQFKQSKKDILWMIRPCSIRCSNGLITSPINIDSEISLPKTVNTHKYSLNPQTAMAMQKTVLCRNCSKPMEADKMCEISYRMVISASAKGEMPELLKKIHTQMNLPEYEKFKNNPLFLSKQTLICDICFLDYASKTRTSGVNMRAESRLTLEIPGLDPNKTSKRREITNLSILKKVSQTTKNSRETTGLPRINTAATLATQKSLAKMLGMNDITAFLEDRYANRRLVTR